jgi:hypothetical protein
MPLCFDYDCQWTGCGAWGREGSGSLQGRKVQQDESYLSSGDLPALNSPYES